MEQTIQSFYDFLKENYGISNTEEINPESGILKQVSVDIPGLSKNLPQQNWSIHLQGEGEYLSLVLGTHWPQENCAWSRYLEIEKQPHSTYLFFRLVETLHFVKDHDLKSLQAFIKVWEEFFEEVPTLA